MSVVPIVRTARTWLVACCFSDRRMGRPLQSHSWSSLSMSHANAPTLFWTVASEPAINIGPAFKLCARSSAHSFMSFVEIRRCVCSGWRCACSKKDVGSLYFATEVVGLVIAINVCPL